MNYLDICPPAVVEYIQAADLRKASSSALFTWVEANADRQCALATLEAVAGWLTPESDLSVVDLFCNTVAAYAQLLDEDQKAIIKAAYRRMPYDPAISMNYFLGLRKAGIDLRSHLRGRIKPDWSFAGPRRDAETWDHYLYLASLDEPGALEALADKIAATESGNDATLLLKSLADLPGPGVEAVLKSYADDPRTADGIDGPGMAISENVRLLLAWRGR